MTNPLPRSKVTKNQTWNAESVFASPKKFDAEVKSLPFCPFRPFLKIL